MSTPRSSRLAEEVRLTPLSLNIAALVFLFAIPVFALKSAGGSARLSGVLFSVLGAGILHGLGVLIRLHSQQGEAVERFHERFTEEFQSIVSTLEKATLAAPAIDTKLIPITETRLAIRQNRWEDARQIVLEFEAAHPDDAAKLAKELDDARNAARVELLSKIAAAREVNDPERVIELREGLRQVVESGQLQTIDRDLAKWFMALIHRRLRTGTVRQDVAVLASRVAACLDETPEGASLRASLPTLRRAAGLCARCGQPYSGVAEACPACLAGVNSPAGFASSGEAADPDEGLEPVELVDEFGMGSLGD